MPGSDPLRGGVRKLGPTEAAELRALRESRRPESSESSAASTASTKVSAESAPEFVKEVKFTINGKEYIVGSEEQAKTSLNAYIRDVAGLTGTKFMCYEGGCGACIVSATAEHPVSKQRETFAINSCLVPVLTVHGWEITTVEGIGDKRRGYHAVQANLAHFNATQCGYCSPGMVMNMYSLLEGGRANTMADVENSFGGNICRCTGYRPILDAFKSLTTDATPQLKEACVDIEDTIKICSKTGAKCSGSCHKNSTEEQSSCSRPVKLELAADNKWYKARSIADIFAALNEIGDAPYKLVAGNTAEGVYRSSGIQVFIDVKDVAELRKITPGESTLTLGGNVTLTEAMREFNSASNPNFKYLTKLAHHIDLIANVPVRNVGTLAGNLATKKAHHEFPSDIFTIFETVGAKLNIMESGETKTTVTLTDFLQHDMNKKIIHSIELPALTENHRLRTFKITPRAQNAHAYVNAGFLFKFENTTNWKVVGQPRIVFGGISPNFVHASNTETFLTGKSLVEDASITGALGELERQLIPDHYLPDAAPEYRKNLAQALFYKFILGLDSSKVNNKHRSGAADLERGLSSGKQTFDTEKTLWPLNQPVPKVEAVAQCSGEAQFINDMPPVPGELHGAFVLTRVSSGKISKINADAAIAMSGVIAFYQHTDLDGGTNTFTPKDFGYSENEEIFCSGNVKYAGQAVGLVVAETRELALQAADAVELEYEKVDKPVVTIHEVLKSAGNRILSLDNENEAKKVVKGSKEPAKEISGEFEIGKQHHFHMELQTCRVVPSEGGYDVYCATQWMDLSQAIVARILRVPASQINMVVRRLGGAYGGKITRPGQLSGACAIAVKKLNRPIRIVMDMQDTLELQGKRFGFRSEYKVGVDTAGKIESLKATIYQDSGCNFNDSPLSSCIKFFANCYDNTHFEVDGRQIRTDTASNTWCRAPGTTEGIALIEEVMERIARTMGLDPVAVRLANMHTKDNPLPAMIEELKVKSDYEARKTAIAAFNAENRWKKRGMSLVPMQYRFGIWGNLSTLVSIYKIDGSVAITHGGIEMGQGINTKVAQVAAHILGVPLNLVSVKPSNSLDAPNSIVTGGSIASEAVAYATLKACQELLKRLEPIKSTMTNPTWQQLIMKANMMNVELCATHMFTTKDDVKAYNIWGATVAEVEVDILTGERQVLRVDIMEDVGQSLSPMIDIGQIEGAFVMGMGYWMSEELIHEPATGRLLNTRTWNYKPPGAKDIPVDFRVHFKKNANNPEGVLQSKATGEPPLNMSIVVLFALRAAVDAAREDVGAPHNEYIPLTGPATPERIFLASKTQPTQFHL